MSNYAKEIEIADDYTEVLDRLFEQIAATEGSASNSIRRDLVNQLELYERHVAEIKTLFPTERGVAFYESMGHFYRGRLALYGEDFLGNVLVSSTRKSTDIGETLLLGWLAGKQMSSSFKQSARAAIAHYNRAIAICNLEFYRLNRARLYHSLDEFAQALADVESILKNSDSDYYTNARKLKLEIEQSQAKKKSKGDCFIATAVYGSPDMPEVQLLRQFRDEVLVETWLGRQFITVYYRLSPPIAALLRRTHLGRRFVRVWIISPIVSIILANSIQE